MKLRTTLSGIAALLLVGVFYSFAFMVEEVDDSAISMEYYYSTQTESAEAQVSLAEIAAAETDKNSAEADEIIEIKPALEQLPDVSENALPDEAREEQPASEASEDAEQDMPEEAVTEAPSVTTAAPAQDKEEQTVSAAPVTESPSVDDNEIEYPEDFDVDDYDSGSSEALEQSVFGEDTNSDKVLSNDEDVPEDTTAPETEPEEITFTFAEDTVSETFPVAVDEIIITIWGESDVPAPETSVSVSVGNGGSDISTDETFTAKFNGSVQTVNAYDLICQIVNNEVSASFSDEAIKAQAVAAYSYVKYHNVNGLTPSVLVKGNVPDKIKRLVSEVWGVCCYYNGNVAQTVYMASSSGYTTDAKNVWGSSVPYLKSVACPFDVNDPNYGYQMKVSEENMRTMVEKKLGITLSNDPSNWFRVTEIVDGNYVSKVNVDGQKTITGRTMRESILAYKLKSAAFEVAYSDGYFVFTTYGYGHGVGMSQNGANILAKQGYSYDEILKHYFTGIEVL